MRINEVWERLSGSVPVCVCQCMHVLAIKDVQISCFAAMSGCGAKRPSRDYSSTCCWMPPGTDWALQAGILSIQPLQAAWETGDRATDSLLPISLLLSINVMGNSWFYWSFCQLVLNLCLILTCSKSFSKASLALFLTLLMSFYFHLHCQFTIPPWPRSFSHTSLYSPQTIILFFHIHSNAFDNAKVHLHSHCAFQSYNYTCHALFKRFVSGEFFFLSFFYTHLMLASLQYFKSLSNTLL